MPVIDVTAQNDFLDANYGPTRASFLTDSYEIQLWSGDPRDTGSHEVSGGGYAAVAWERDDWGPAEGGETETTSSVDFVLTGALDDDDSVTHWLEFNVTTGKQGVSMPLDEEQLPTGATTLSVVPTIAFADQS